MKKNNISVSYNDILENLKAKRAAKNGKRDFELSDSETFNDFDVESLEAYRTAVNSKMSGGATD